MRNAAIALWQVTALPLLWLGWLHWRGHRRALPWWLMASAFGVSWVADLFGFLGWFAEASQVYPILLASLMGMAMLPKFGAAVLASGLFWTALLSIGVRHGLGFDVWLHVVAFGGVSAVATLVLPPTRIQWVLAWGFVALAVLWPLSVHWTAFPTLTWALYHAAWLATTCGFCYAVSREGR